ncbi:MAG TPA: threonine--tRNA ligase [Streptosporangiaceae bacterium]
MSAQQLHITLAGREHVVDAGTTAGDALQPAGPAAGPRSTVIAARINGELRDLAAPLADGDAVEPVEVGSDDGRAIMRHSTAHVMAQAVQELFPEAKLGIGPPVENGFYYDFDVAAPFSPEDLKAIEQRMRQIVKQGQLFSRREVSDEEARKELAGEPYKLELIGLKGGSATPDAGSPTAPSEVSVEEAVEVGGSQLTIYDNLDPATGQECWKDLCRGPHVPTTRQIPAFKVMRSSGAYWRGSEKNPQLQRIYGTAWESREAQDDYLKLLAEAERRDHRRLGAELDLFSFPTEIGSGLPVFHPKGAIIRRVMEDYARRRHEEAGYQYVNTPHLTKEELFQTSGHLGFYAESMFPPMELDGARYYMKPMNCPMHVLIYSSRGRSYRELPLRLFEFGTVYRYEKSGVVHGLTRVRGLTMDDAHIFCTREQAGEQLRKLLTFVLDLLRDYGLNDFYLELSTRDDVKDKWVGSPEDWEQATGELRQAALASGLELVADPGGAAFYGPKISVQVRDAIGRTWQLSTIQVDYNLPKRFGLEYQAADGSRQQPIMIHRALFGSIERFLGILVEHYAGAFPPWLAPVQVVGIPIADAHASYLEGVAAQLRERGIRVEVDTADDRMQKKIRTAQKQKVPFMLLAGDDDVSKGAVSFRYRSGEQRNGVPVSEAIAEIVSAVDRRIQV